MTRNNSRCTQASSGTIVFSVRAFGGLFIAAFFLALLAAFLMTSPDAPTKFPIAGDRSFRTFFWRIRTYVDAVINLAKLSSNASPDTLPPCKGPACLDEGIGARLFQEEIRHLHNILDLADGFGRPLGQVFDADYTLVRSVTLYTGVIADKSRHKFQMDALHFLQRIRMVDRLLLRAGLKIFSNFHSIFPGVGPGSQLMIAFGLLDATHSLRNSEIDRKAFQNDRWRYIQEVDDFVSETAKNFTGKLLVQLEDILPSVQEASSLAEIARTMATTLLLPELDNEKSRVAQTLRDLPWWDRFTLLHLLKGSRTSYFNEYSRLLADKEPLIRSYAEGIQIVADNLLMITDYVIWYRSRQSKPIDARHIPRKLSSDDELHKLKQAIDDYLDLAEMRYKGYKAPASNPRRLIFGGVPFTLPAPSP